MSMEILKIYAISMMGLPGIWGGQNPVVGFDCSGLVNELLWAAGEIPHGVDRTAQELFNYYERNGHWNTYGLGALAFYGDNYKNVKHVGWSFDDEFMIEAGGVKPHIKTKADAQEHGAWVRIRPIKYRRDFLVTIKPYYRKLKR